MKNYKNSSYAANKYSKDIVYNSEVSGSTSITLDDFLKSDPTLTKADFEFWKNWSDEDYRVESKETNNQTKKDVSFTSLDEVVAGFGLSLEEQYEEDECERIYLTAVREAMRRFLNDKSISSTTKERFRLHFINGERVLDISERHGVQSSSVCKGLKKSLNKFKGYFFLCVRDIMER